MANDSDKKMVSAERAASQRLYQELSAPFTDKKAIEETKGAMTGRGYDTTGIKYQYIVNRLNEVLGLGGYRAQREITVKQTATARGRPGYEAICDIVLQLGEWVEGEFIVFAEALADGGHFSMSESDARKGAYTNAFKKAAAFFGVGRQAYEGTLDDDNAPQSSGENEPSPFNESTTPARVTPVNAPAKAPAQKPRQPVRAVRLADPPHEPEMSEAAKSRALTTLARNQQIFEKALATGVSREGFPGWAVTILGRRHDSSADWTEDDRCHLEEELLAREAKVAQMAQKENLQNSPALRNGSGRPVPVKQP